MLYALADLAAAAGLDHPRDFRPEHFSRRISPTELMTYAELYPALRRGELLSGAHDKRWRDSWDMARGGILRAGFCLRPLQFHRDPVRIDEEALTDARPGLPARGRVAHAKAVEPLQGRVEVAAGEGDVLNNGAGAVLRPGFPTVR